MKRKGADISSTIECNMGQTNWEPGKNMSRREKVKTYKRKKKGGKRRVVKVRSYTRKRRRG